MKDTLLFIDPCCPRSYDPASLDGPGIGGTEHTVVCLAEGLSEHFNVVVEQHCRKESYAGRARYTGPGICSSARFVVVLREAGHLINARERFPDSKVYLWSHDLTGRHIGEHFRAGTFEATHCVANVCVSHWHRSQTIEALKPWGYTGQFRIKTIYNPLSANVVKRDSGYDKNKLMWMASPHKGLDRALELFKILKAINKEFEFYVTNPGYLKDATSQQEGVTILGTRSHDSVIQQVGHSLCLFYPNTVFPETFGKILAEANAMGTPVLTHPLGAVREVLDSHPAQILDCRNTEAVVKRVMSWYEGVRPTVSGNPKFKLSNVVQDWVRLLHDLR